MKNQLIVLAIVGFLAAGCCSNPGVFNKLETSLQTVQSYYGPLIAKVPGMTSVVSEAVTAADSTLLMAGTLQTQWCPAAGAAAQVQIQAASAAKLAVQAGVPEAVPAAAAATAAVPTQ